MRLGDTNMYITLNEISIQVEIVNSNLVHNSKVSGKEDWVHFVLLAKAECVYVQGSADYIDNPSLCKPFDYNLHKILLGQVKQETSGSAQYRVTLIVASCLIPWPSERL